MDEYLHFAKNLVKQGGKIILENSARKFSVEVKSDNSPVTEIDKQINQLIIESVKSYYPDHGVLGEEASFGSGQEKLQWICDPLDDTKAFVAHGHTSCCILGLASDGDLLVSVVYNPYADKLYWAIRGRGAFCNGEPMQVSQKLITESPVLLGENSSHVFIKEIEAAGGVVEISSGTGHKAMLLASGHGSGFMKIETDYHDVGPSALIIEEAGGKVTNLEGGNYKYNHEIHGAILSNGVAHDSLIKIAERALTNEA